LTPSHTLLISLPIANNYVPVRKLTHTHPHGDEVRMFDLFVQNTSENVGQPVEVALPGVSEQETQHEECHKHDSYVVFTGIQEQGSDVLHSIREQLNVLQKRVSWNFRARFIVVTSLPVNISIQQFGFMIFEEMWRNYTVMNALLIISVNKFKVNDRTINSETPYRNDSQAELQLYTWFPFTSHTHCDQVHDIVLLDRWTPKGEFFLNANLFPEKVPKTFHGCKSKVTTFIYPPAVMKTSQLEYTGLEIHFLLTIFKTLNLTAEYNIIPYNHTSHYEQFYYTILQLKPASSDLSIGILPSNIRDTSFAEATISYLDFKCKWYVPCPNQASQWKVMCKIFSLQVWLYFCFAIFVAIVTMLLLAKYARYNNVQESTQYTTIMHCAYNVWALTTGISVHEKPIASSLRIFFVMWVWFSFAMTTLFQTNFVGFLVNPGFEKSFSTLNEIIQSGIEYGYLNEMDFKQFSDPTYDIVKKNRKICKSLFKCLERVIKNKDFAVVADNFHEKYVSTRLLFYDTHIPICSLPDDIMRYSVSTYMAKGNPILYRFNENIRHLFEAGLLEKWTSDFFSNVRLVGQPIDGDDTSFENITETDLNGDYSTYSLVHLQVIFYMLLLGYTFSISVFIGEVLYHKT
jgi:hypothetical protein